MVYMYHNFLVHSSADGHLGCVHVLAMINSAKKKKKMSCQYISILDIESKKDGRHMKECKRFMIHSEYI